jgi:Family of unknown function (DUF6912)
MSRTRIYVPLTPPMVRALAEAREIAPTPIAAHTVTPRLERAHPSADEEEREYAALCEAAEAAGALSSGSVVRRVVVAADVESTWVDPRRGEGSDVLSTVDITEPVPLRLVASFHVDEVPGQDDDELLWYDVTELPEVVRLAGA